LEKRQSQIETNPKIEQSNIDATLNISQTNNNLISDSSFVQIFTEDDLLKSYVEFLENAKKNIEMLFLCHSKQEFLNIMNEKGIKSKPQSKNRMKRRTVGLMTANPDAKEKIELEKEEIEQLIKGEQEKQDEIMKAFIEEVKYFL
jgi:hypothetical protein